MGDRMPLGEVSWELAGVVLRVFKKHGLETGVGERLAPMDQTTLLGPGRGASPGDGLCACL